MNVRNIDHNAVTLYERNAKFHPQSQIDRIAKSIERFGFRQPVVIDGRWSDFQETKCTNDE